VHDAGDATAGNLDAVARHYGSRALEANRNLLNPHFTMVSENWSTEDRTRNWQYKADA
jgi:hypothetical protein